ncbi:NADH dehydrogenase [ubiquinone] 1 beta subcomplex subunit 9-like isoform X2 [Cucurbita maxima]|uniref:NADH dehydrogenase [ubiquinone] 1 beta subcomplex subunit 9 n=2 Tax=Cucurbita TaxID=3660 RepID=A0A6J1JEK9_CUCMA|nr:NADH dehydrogenase [ubiquinone] 1 beta subcomplex subunit 9-like isoform X2 [Cucurbita moschata]XP_022986640.1 NADH dehydrogenase [ubiquinone] 1 beta subcomplex subunit 9-like isoform X2 [Cucurbita maxima]
MSFSSTAGYLARRAAQKERVRILYRRALKDTLNWAVHRHLFYRDASDLRERFDANKHVEDLDRIDRMIADGEASYNKWRHPDPYIGMLMSKQSSPSSQMVASSHLKL